MPHLFFFLNLATLYQHVTKEWRQAGGTQGHTTASDRRSRAWTLAGAMPAGLGCTPLPGTPTPSAAHLPFLLEARLHPGGLEDPGRGRANSKGQGFLDPEPLPAVPPSSPAPSQVNPRQAAALLADRQRGAALSAHSGPGCCLPAPAALLTHLGTWVALLPRGAGLSLGTLQET